MPTLSATSSSWTRRTGLVTSTLACSWATLQTCPETRPMTPTCTTNMPTLCKVCALVAALVVSPRGRHAFRGRGRGGLSRGMPKPGPSHYLLPSTGPSATISKGRGGKVKGKTVKGKQPTSPCNICGGWHRHQKRLRQRPHTPRSFSALLHSFPAWYPALSFARLYRSTYPQHAPPTNPIPRHHSHH